MNKIPWIGLAIVGVIICSIGVFMAAVGDPEPGVRNNDFLGHLSGLGLAVSWTIILVRLFRRLKSGD